MRSANITPITQFFTYMLQIPTTMLFEAKNFDKHTTISGLTNIQKVITCR